ncbi:MAG: pentapeptide repeat-containing protein [Pseudonocardia sp.]|nr:pentapeptide repeat-containing protein [Pseudonocardia sp.]
MARRTRPTKILPDRPELPARFDRAPAAAEPGALWDGVEAGPNTVFPAELPDLDLRECRFAGADLSGRTLTGFTCRDTEFVHCDLSGAMLDSATLRRVTLTDCRLTGTVLSGAALNDVRITACRADLVNLRMARAGFLLVEQSMLRGADLYAMTAADSALLDCDLTGSTVTEARLTGMRLHGSTVDDLHGVASLRGARIGADQLVTLGAALLAAHEIAVTERA